MSVQKKSLISQRSAVKSALLATTATSQVDAATKSSVKPALSNKWRQPGRPHGRLQAGDTGGQEGGGQRR